MIVAACRWRVGNLNAFRPGVGSQIPEAVRDPLLIFGLERMVDGRIILRIVGNAAEQWIRTPRLNRAWPGRGIVDRISLVKGDAVIAHIVDFDNRTGGQ